MDDHIGSETHVDFVMRNGGRWKVCKVIVPTPDSSCQISMHRNSSAPWVTDPNWF